MQCRRINAVYKTFLLWNPELKFIHFVILHHELDVDYIRLHGLELQLAISVALNIRWVFPMPDNPLNVFWNENAT